MAAATAPAAAKPDASASGEFKIGGELPVHRLGYGAMRITGKGIWGEPENPEEAVRVLRRIPELGINFIDTANSYGPEVSERLIGDTLAPYANGLVVATKVGLTRQGPDQWLPVARPEYMRECLEMSLRRLKVDTIDLYQLHRIDSKVPAEEQFTELRKFQDEGKVRFLGLSEVSVDEIKHAQQFFEVASVQNLYNLVNRKSEEVLNYCEQNNIGFIPWFPVAAGELARPGGVLDSIAKEHDATVAQLALAWLLKRSPVMLPIPGTSSVKHLEENAAAASIEISDDDFKKLEEAGRAASDKSN